jgi:O-antigen/teichoic acid export membrane protein
VIDMARQLVTTLAIVALVVAGAGLEPFFAVYTLGLVVMLGATLVPAGRWRRLWPEFDRARWAQLLRQTALFAVATAVGVVYFQVAIISTSLLAGQTEAGLYGASFRILELANGVPWLLVTAAFPVVARAAATDAGRLRHALQRLFDVALLAGGLFTVVIVVGAPVAMAFLGGDKLDPAIGVLQVLGLALPFRFLVATWTYALLSVHADRGLLAANGLALAVSVVLSLLLIPSFGAEGAAYVTTALEAVLTCALAVALVRARPDLRPQVAGLPRFLACLAVALAAGLLVPLPAVPATVLAAALYTAGMWATGGVPRELGDAVRERLGR